MEKASPSITVFKKITFQFLTIEHFLQRFKINKLQTKLMVLVQQEYVIPMVLKQRLVLFQLNFSSVDSLRDMAKMKVVELF